MENYDITKKDLEFLQKLGMKTDKKNIVFLEQCFIIR